MTELDAEVDSEAPVPKGQVTKISVSGGDNGKPPAGITTLTCTANSCKSSLLYVGVDR